MSTQSTDTDMAAVGLAMDRFRAIASYFANPDPSLWERVILEVRSYETPWLEKGEVELFYQGALNPDDLEVKMALWIVLAARVEELRQAFCRVYVDGDVPITSLNPHRAVLEKPLDLGSTPEQSLKLYDLICTLQEQAKQDLRRVRLQVIVNRLTGNHLAVVKSFPLNPVVQLIVERPNISRAASEEQLDDYQRACELVEARLKRLDQGGIDLYNEYVHLRNRTGSDVLEAAIRMLSLHHRRALVREPKPGEGEKDVLERLLALEYFQAAVEEALRQRAARDTPAAA